MEKLKAEVWSAVITTIQNEIENLEKDLGMQILKDDEFLKQRKSNLEIALKEFETQQLEDLLN